MQKHIYSLVILSLLVATHVKANVLENFYLPRFYVGGDLQVRKMHFVNDFGGNALKDEYPEGNIYFGIKGNEYIGMESGFEFSKSHTRTVLLQPGSVLFGVQQEFLLRQNIVTKIRGLHTSLIGFIPLWEGGHESIKLLAAAGVVNLKIHIRNLITEIQNMPAAEPLFLSGSKNVLRLMTGIQYMYNCNIGFRANIRWENTAELKNIAPIGFYTPEKAKAKNSYVYGLGIVLSF